MCKKVDFYLQIVDLQAAGAQLVERLALQLARFGIWCYCRCDQVDEARVALAGAAVSKIIRSQNMNKK